MNTAWLSLLQTSTLATPICPTTTWTMSTQTSAPSSAPGRRHKNVGMRHLMVSAHQRVLSISMRSIWTSLMVFHGCRDGDNHLSLDILKNYNNIWKPCSKMVMSKTTCSHARQFQIENVLGQFSLFTYIVEHTRTLHTQHIKSICIIQETTTIYGHI